MQARFPSRLALVCACSIASWRCGARTSLYAPVRFDDGATDAMAPDAERPPSIAVAMGPYTACALLLDGAVKCWGSDWGGALGEGMPASSGCHSSPCSTLPVVVTGVSGAMALTPTCTLSHTGAAECWGANEYGELGLGSSMGPEQCVARNTAALPCSRTPVGVVNLVGATALASGLDHSCALLEDRTVQCWGGNMSGQLGVGTTTGPETCSSGSCSTKPVPVADLTNVTGIAAGGSFTCAVHDSGVVDCWGDNSLGELGNGSTTSSSTAARVSGLTDVTAIGAGSGHACALRSDGSVLCWGDNQAGQLGTGATGPDTCGMTPCSWKPLLVKKRAKATAIAVGDLDTCALLTDGTVACWGDNVSGELGNGMHTGPDTCTAGVACSKTPVPVSGLTGVTAIAAGGASACAVVGGTTVECWGDNTFGELGVGTSNGPLGCSVTCSPTPVAVLGL